MSTIPLHQIPLTLIDGTPTTFGRFAGKTVLVVNVASKCGFTPQYAGLEAIYRRFAGDGLVVLGVPCNQFLGEEPGSEQEILEFCEMNFQVTFPLTSKVDVRGKNQHPLYAALTTFKKGVLPALIKWNFEKFLVNSDCVVVDRFASIVEPESEQLVAAITKALVPAAA